ncbi:hypothetical protein PAMC26510_22270 [Caballeronia sordidicola]|uniref:Uncharacterized protein n=1 Tax=Caballeronia sordidicola TaxID=196367 RepID=A0A242MLL4_CABSO|nr:hypothetical protein PAMC26510_22270 [Caballeronia sordidicola]
MLLALAIAKARRVLTGAWVETPSWPRVWTQAGTSRPHGRVG